MRLEFTTLTTVLIILISFSWALQNEPVTHSALEARSAEEGEWIDLSVGVRMKRDEGATSHLEKRSENPTSTTVLLKRSPETGKLVWPSSFSEALTMAKRNVETFKSSLHRRTAAVRKAMKVKITWYNGHDLLYPSCFSESDNWAPTDKSMVAAVTIEWPGKPPCGSFVRIHHHSKSDKNITVRIVDSCAGCDKGSAHLDLTTGAFEKLYDQDVGMVEGLKAQIVPCPAGIDEDWNHHVIARYGPQKTISQKKTS